MSSGRVKIAEYYQRGGPLTIEEITQVFVAHPWLTPPKNVLVLDGDVRTTKGTAVGLTPPGESTIILTPISNKETVLHEWLHESLGVGEIGARLLTPILMRKPNLGLMQKQVAYDICSECTTHPYLFERYGLEPEFAGYPQIRHYKLTER